MLLLKKKSCCSVLIVLCITLFSCGDKSSGSSDKNWKLPEENYISAKQPMRLIYPQPDCETESNEYHRSAHPGELYEVKIGVAFGAYPYHLKFNSKPGQAKIGCNYGDDGYLTVSWTPGNDDLGEHFFDITVYDQDSNTINVSWSCTVETNGHDLVDEKNGTDLAGNGSQAKPYRTLAYMFSQNHAKEICHIKEGDYSLEKDVSSNLGLTGPIALVGAGMTKTSINCSGTPDTSKSTFLVQNDGVFIGKLRLHSINSAKENPRYVNLHDLYSRVIVYSVHFDGSSSGTKGNDNNSCFFMPSDNRPRFMYNHMMSNCRFDNLVYSGNGFSAFDAYRVDGFLCSDNIFGKAASGMGSRYVLWVKGIGNRNFTIRGNIWEESWSGENLCAMYLSTSGDEYSGNMEICYNRILHDDSSYSYGAAAAIMLFGGYGTDDAVNLRGPIWSYRNTIVGLVVIKEYDTFPVEFHSENYIIIHESSVDGVDHKVLMRNSNDGAGAFRDPETRSGGITFSCTGYELHQSPDAGVLDSSYSLSGAYRREYLYKRGHEIGND